MPFDIDYRNVPGGKLLETQYGVGNAGGAPGGGMGGSFGGSMSGPGMPDMSQFFQAMAQRQAEAENYKRQQQAEAIARQQEAQQYERRKAEQMQAMQQDQMRRQQHLQNDAMDAQKRNAFAQAEDMGPNTDVHWMKNFGIGKGGDFGGPVEVAPGTFGAQRVSTGVSSGMADAAAKRGLTPGLAGQRLGGTDKLLGDISGTEDDENDRTAKNRWRINQLSADRGF